DVPKQPAPASANPVRDGLPDWLFSLFHLDGNHTTCGPPASRREKKGRAIRGDLRGLRAPNSRRQRVSPPDASPCEAGAAIAGISSLRIRLLKSARSLSFSCRYFAICSSSCLLNRSNTSCDDCVGAVSAL